MKTMYFSMPAHFEIILKYGSRSLEPVVSNPHKPGSFQFMARSNVPPMPHVGA